MIMVYKYTHIHLSLSTCTLAVFFSLCVCVWFVCRTNDDDFLPVDLAAMLDHQTIVRMLLEKGAKDSAKCM